MCLLLCISVRQKIKLLLSLVEDNNKEKNTKRFHTYIPTELIIFNQPLNLPLFCTYFLMSNFVLCISCLFFFFFTVNVYFSLKNPQKYKMEMALREISYGLSHFFISFFLSFLAKNKMQNTFYILGKGFTFVLRNDNM